MTPAAVILVAWIFFGGTHIALSSSRLREKLINILSARQFTVLFVVVTIISMTGLIVTCTLYGDQGIAGPSIGKSGGLRFIMAGVSFLGAVLMIAGLINYPNSPFPVLARQMRKASLSYSPLKPSNGLEHVTRHPFFVGLAIVTTIHALHATTLASFIYFAGYAVLAVLGIYFQDRKLRRRWPAAYGNYEAQTGKVFRLTTNNSARQPWSTWVLALIISSILFIGFHAVWTYANGAVFAFFILIFGTLATVAALFKAEQGPDI